MPTHPDLPQPLHGWTVVSLRPRGQHGSLRKAANRHGARLLALSPFAIEPLADLAHLQALEQALAADIVVWTSPNAVRAAAALQPLRARHEQARLAVGSGTQRALQHAGVDARAPARMDSEGLLAMPELNAVRGCSVGLITAPGGRGLLASTLSERGAAVVRADVYARRPLTFSSRALAALSVVLAAPHHTLLALSSGEALQVLLAATSHPALADIAVVAASERLARAAQQTGFNRIAVATSAAPAALMQAAAKAFV